ncbi:lactonase family protein [Paraburkholderia fynbosensis]|nr:lactonase family protein [Paraburkholderia fynbosensis]
MSKASLLAIAFAMTTLLSNVHAADFMYVGTWNNVQASPQLGFSKGVYGWQLDKSSGEVKPLGVVAKTVTSPDSLASSPDGRYLYVTEYNGCVCTRSWPFPGAPRAGVSAYAISPTDGSLTLLNSVDGLGDMPAEIGVDATGKTLALANYYGGNVVTYRIERDGRLGPAVNNIHHVGAGSHESAGPHPHGLAFSHDNRWLFVTDQGLDRVYSYVFDAKTSSIHPASPVPFIQLESGQGPRNIAVHPNNKWIYVDTEEGGRVYLMSRGADGALTAQQSVSAIPDGTMQLGTAQVHVSPDGSFLYVNHRPNENIAVFSIDQNNGRLALIGFTPSSSRAVIGNRAPVPSWKEKTLWEKVETGARSFAWDMTATWVASANLGENSVALLKRNPTTGKLTSTGTAVSVPQPTYAIFVSPK